MALESPAALPAVLDQQRTPTQTRRVIISSLVGTTLEYYEFFVYGTVSALAFNAVFFPKGNALAASLATFAIFAVGFLARPVGSILFGHWGDRLGRKRTLILSLSLMGISTVLIGCLPSFAMAGVLAPILLIVLRIVQGLALGGEWGGAALMLVESAPKGRKSQVGSVVMIGVPAGLVIAAGVAALSVVISGDAFTDWGWRIPFLASVVLVAVAFYIRLGVQESPEFTAARERIEHAPKAPIAEVLRHNWTDLLAALGAGAPGNAIFFLVSVYTLSYTTSNLGMDREPVLYTQIAAASIYVFTIPLFGRLADRIGEWKLVLAGSIATILFALVYFPMLNTKSIPVIFLAMLGSLAVVHAMLQAPQASLFASRFDVSRRYTGAALSQALPTMLIGGTAPFIATYLIGITGNSTVLVSAYVVVLAIAGVAAAFAYRAKDRSRIEA